MIRWTSAVNLLHDRVDLSTAGDIRKLCGHFLLPALEFSEFLELLDATGFPVTRKK